jgi:hypothetical protein
MTKVYVGNWESAEDMKRDFEISDKDLEGTEILFAGYEYGSYEGDAFVLFKRDGKLYEVNAGHCSCYGIEGQWDPEETTVEAIEKRQPDLYGEHRLAIIDAARSFVP